METTLNIETTGETTELRAAQQRDALVESLLTGMTGLFTHYSVYLGDQLGFYATLARHAHLNSSELAALTGTHERYVREWLEQQAMYGILVAENPGAGPLERRFSLPAGHAEVLTMRDSLSYLAPLSRLLTGVASPINELLAAYRTGQGVPYENFGEDMRLGQAEMNRATFLQELGQVWLPAMPDVHQRLQQPGARVADIGCGCGWSSIGMARAYPQARVDGFDLDRPSIEQARKNAASYGLAGRVHFEVQDVSAPGLAGTYDLATAFECLHDMSDPVGALKNMRRMINDTGSVLIVDERAAETFEPGGENSQLDAIFYGFSILHCLPAGMCERPSAATGTVMRPSTLRQYAQEAGFKEVEVLPVENFFFRLYRLIA